MEKYNVFDFLREVVSKVPDYGQAQGSGDVTMEDRSVSKRRLLDFLALYISAYLIDKLVSRW